MVKIKGEDETLETWNFILKLFKPSYADLVKKLFGLSATRSLDIAYSYGSQPQKCQNDVFLENRVPIDGFLWKLAKMLGLTTEPMSIRIKFTPWR